MGKIGLFVSWGQIETNLPSWDMSICCIGQIWMNYEDEIIHLGLEGSPAHPGGVGVYGGRAVLPKPHGEEASLHVSILQKLSQSPGGSLVRVFFNYNFFPEI